MPPRPCRGRSSGNACGSPTSRFPVNPRKGQVWAGHPREGNDGEGTPLPELRVRHRVQRRDEQDPRVPTVRPPVGGGPREGPRGEGRLSAGQRFNRTLGIAGGPMPKPASSKAPPRADHPYYMHDAIMGQPAAIEAVLAAAGDPYERAAESVTEADRVYVTGMGTSLHAATVGRYLLEHTLGAEADLRVASAFELAVRGKFSKSDAVIVVSHRGWKRYAARVVELAKAGQAATIAVTGKAGGDAVRAASTVLETCEQERSAAHTVSYTTAIALLSRIAVEAGRAAGRTAPPEGLSKDVTAAPKGMAGGLKKERRFVPPPQDLPAGGGVPLLGTGPPPPPAPGGGPTNVQ